MEPRTIIGQMQMMESIGEEQSTEASLTSRVTPNKIRYASDSFESSDPVWN